MRRFVLITAVLWCGFGMAAEAPLWLAVGPKELVEAIEPLAAHRRAEGLRTAVIAGTVAEALAEAPAPPRYLLLVGDADPKQPDATWQLPARRVPFYRWSEKLPEHFASDMIYGDLDGDEIPDIPVGRIPARTPEQVAAVVQKILAYETQSPEAKDLRLLAWAGAPGYGEAIDSKITALLISTIKRFEPPWIEPWLISSDTKHRLCGWPEDQPKLFADQLHQGGLLATFMGHATEDSCRVMGEHKTKIVFDTSHGEAVLREGAPGPPLIFYTCRSGNFTYPKPCLTENYLFMPGGPVATIGATILSHPIPNTFSGVCLLEALAGPEKRVGDVWLKAERDALAMTDPIMDWLISLSDRKEAKMDQGKLKRNHFLMYAILGDPATPMRIPDPLAVETTQAEQGWSWTVTPPEGATRLEVSHRAPLPDFWPPVFEELDAAAAQALLEETNAAYHFQPVATLEQGVPWQGTVDTPGRLRFIATGPKKIYAAAVDLE